jgi:hypothetical protein
MRNRWIAGAAVAATLALGACAPTDSGEEAGESAAPSTESTTAPSVGEDATPAPAADDEY